MGRNSIRLFTGLVAALGAAVFAAPVQAQTSGSNGSHDPSRMIESDGKVYIYSTGGGGKSSSDGLVWAAEGTPPWNTSLLPNNQRIWAPDGIRLNGQIYLFGSMWSDAKASAIILLKTPSLNAASAKWTDGGVVISGPAGVTHSCIDPAPLLDAQGNLWVVWGGGYPFDNAANSIFVTRLDNATGLPVTADPGYKPPNSPGYALKQGHKEGPYIHYHDGYYYLWWQTGNCCQSATNKTGYVMHMARSKDVTGPYPDDKTFYGSQSNPYIGGPGHIGIYTCGGVERFTYHYYPDGTTGSSFVGENTLTWGADGWPVAGPRVTTPLKLPCSDGAAGSGGAGGSNPTVDGGTTTDGGGGTGGRIASSGGASGMTGGTSGTGGTAGNRGTGGVPQGTGGSLATSSGGTSSSTGGTNVGTGGSASGSGGKSATGGAAAPSNTASTGGCACNVGRRTEMDDLLTSLMLLLVAALAGATPRRLSPPLLTSATGTKSCRRSRRRDDQLSNCRTSHSR